MIRFAASHYDGRSARAAPVECQATGGRLFVRGAELAREVGIDQVSVSPRLGRTPRVLTLPGGAQLHTEDNDAIDQAFPAANRLERSVDRLERRWRAAATAAVITVAAGWAFFAYGVPRMAEAVAAAMPPPVERMMGEQVDKLLANFGFEPTGLDEARRDALGERFAKLRAAVPGGAAYQLEFRRAEMPNAFALPGGRVVVTDELAGWLDDDEITAVLAHELGHLAHRHVMRSVLQDSAVAVVVAMFTGDVSSAGALTVAIPVFLLENHYSRDFERDADAYAVELLRRAGLPPEWYARALRKLAAKQPGAEDERGVMAYASTHPPTSERIRAAEAAATATP